MPQALSMAIRQQIAAHYEKGLSITALSKQYKVSRQTIYTLLSRFKVEGEEGLKPKYDKCGKSRPNSSEFLYRSVRCLRNWHPTWGAEKIHAYMLILRPNLVLPHYRSFYRWFHWNEQIEIKAKTQLPATPAYRASKLHEVWQIDAKEEMQTLDNQKQCWLNIVDEYSGTVIDPPVFSL